MRFLILITLFFANFFPSFAYENKKYEEEDFEKVKLMKIEYLNKRINCVKSSNNHMEMRHCWRKKKK